MSGFSDPPVPWGEPSREDRAAKLAGEVAAEFNGVLTAIASNVALAERHAAGNPKLIRLLNAVRLATERGSILAAKLTALSPRTTAIAGMEEEAAAFGPAKSHGRILVVEDDEQVAELATAVLEEMGHAVVTSGDAVSALALLQDVGGFDLVFSDIVMPGSMNGIQLAEAIAESFPRLPVLLATGYSSKALMPGALRFPILAKPYSVQELNRRITQMLPAAL